MPSLVDEVGAARASLMGSKTWLNTDISSVADCEPMVSMADVRGPREREMEQLSAQMAELEELHAMQKEWALKEELRRLQQSQQCGSGEVDMELDSVQTALPAWWRQCCAKEGVEAERAAMDFLATWLPDEENSENGEGLKDRGERIERRIIALKSARMSAEEKVKQAARRTETVGSEEEEPEVLQERPGGPSCSELCNVP
ncbi:unnamed protein product [Heligmosomoides polygyrus]|uniref:BMERB domain-containing protein n=1 Tax=Heligmosomoides polygyrus TaxID=6339 RepID=A0A183F1U6_HELPZ|nr:unnamed protein product [Heligmosomoides polygyrus]